VTDVREQTTFASRLLHSKWRKRIEQVRRQVGAVTSAVGLLVLVQRIFSLDFRSIVADLAAVWTETIGQVTGWLLHWAIEVPLSLLHIHYRFPEAFRDYIAIGIIVCLSVTRAMSNVRQPKVVKTSWRTVLVLLASTIAVWLAWIMVWPVTLLSAALMSIPAVHSRVSSQLRPRLLRQDEKLPPSSTGVLVLTPIAYLAALLILNVVLS
jgi:hypothetical protein